MDKSSKLSEFKNQKIIKNLYKNNGFKTNRFYFCNKLQIFLFV